MIKPRSISLPSAVHQHYYVDSFGRWFVIRCKDKRTARQWGVKEFGRGNVKIVRQADQKDVETYRAHTGFRLPYEEAPE